MAGREGLITAKRLREAMEVRHLRQTDLCRATGIPKSAMCQYLKGDFSPKAGRLRLLAKALCVNEAWLSGCEGAPMYAPAPSAEQMDPLAAELFSAYAEAKDALSADDIEDVKLFMRMLARRRQAAERQPEHSGIKRAVRRSAPGVQRVACLHREPAAGTAASVHGQTDARNGSPKGSGMAAALWAFLCSPFRKGKEKQAASMALPAFSFS